MPWLQAALLGIVLAAAVTRLHGQESAQEAPKSEQETETRNDPDFKWHLLNTAIFAIAVGYAFVKLGPSFFNARSADIQKAIKDATGLKIEADFRAAEIDRKMATLPDEVKRMREQAHTEMEREHQRRKADTRKEIEQAEAALASEIDGMRAEGAMHIRQRATRAAIRLAEQRLRERAGEMSGSLMSDFAHLVERGKN